MKCCSDKGNKGNCVDKGIRALLLLLLLGTGAGLTTGCASMAPITGLTASDVADRIQKNFEAHLYQLPPRTQGHYGLRLYRITGNPLYLNAVLYDYYAVVDRINAILPNLNNRDYISQQSKRLIADISNGKRGRARRKSLRKYPEFIFYAKTLGYAARLNEYGVNVPTDVIAALARYDFKSALTDKKMIKAWAAQLSNYAYWLRQLGIADYTLAYKNAFLQTYPDDRDHKLSRWQYKNKIYGLTHFIFAASGYYQYSVSAKEFDWIIKYFTKNQQRILDNTSADVMAEVAINYLLAGQADNTLIDKIKAKLLNQFNPDHAMIPSVSGKIDLATGEHRNVLALMLFNWPEQLSPGPCLLQVTDLAKYLPQSPFNWRPTVPTNSRCNLTSSIQTVNTKSRGLNQGVSLEWHLLRHDFKPHSTSALN